MPLKNYPIVAPPFYGRRPSEVSALSLLGSPWISSFVLFTWALNYDIIDLISLIDHVKNATLRLIWNDEGMAETVHVNNIIACNAKQKLSQSGPSPCDNNSIIVAGGCSG